MTNYDYRKVVASIYHIIISENCITVINFINQINLHHTNNDHHILSGKIQPDPVKKLLVNKEISNHRCDIFHHFNSFSSDW